MLSIQPTARFRKSLKKVSKSGSFEPATFNKIINALSCGEELPKNYKDHSLTGDMAGSRECHIEFNLLLIYRVEGGSLILANIGTHPELFG